MPDTTLVQILDTETVTITIVTDDFSLIDLVSENVDLSANTILQINAPDDVSVIEIEEGTLITVLTDDVVSVDIIDNNVGLPGPPGATGTTEAASAAFEAADNLSGRRVVYGVGDGTVDYASNDDPDTIEAIGVTSNAAVLGDDVIVVMSGLLEDSALALIPGPVFLGINGALTQTPPVSGVSLRVGSAIAADKLFVNIESPIYLA